jgi:hypothetical protein
MTFLLASTCPLPGPRVHPGGSPGDGLAWSDLSDQWHVPPALEFIARPLMGRRDRSGEEWRGARRSNSNPTLAPFPPPPGAGGAATERTSGVVAPSRRRRPLRGSVFRAGAREDQPANGSLSRQIARHAPRWYAFPPNRRLTGAHAHGRSLGGRRCSPCRRPPHNRARGSRLVCRARGTPRCRGRGTPRHAAQTR